jgi:hypothetical protein
MGAVNHYLVASLAIVLPGSVRCRNCSLGHLRFSFDLIMFLSVFEAVDVPVIFGHILLI